MPCPRSTTAQESALARAIAHGDTAALVDAVRTGHARLGTKVQHTPRGQSVARAWSRREGRGADVDLTVSHLTACVL